MSPSLHRDETVQSPARSLIAARLRTFAALFLLVIVAGGVLTGLAIDRVLAGEEDQGAGAAATQAPPKSRADGNALVYAAAVVVAVGTMGASFANPELFGRSIVLVGLAEGLAIYGLIVGIFLLIKVQ